MHTPATPEDVRVAPVPVHTISLVRAPAPAEFPQAVPLTRSTQPDAGELDLELIDAWHEQYLALRALEELIESGALAALCD